MFSIAYSCAAEVQVKLMGWFSAYSWESGENYTCSIGQKFGFNLCFVKVKMLCLRRSSVLSQQVQNKFKYARQQKGRSSISKDDAVQRVNQCWKKMRSSISKDEAVRHATQCWKKTKRKEKFNF